MSASDQFKSNADAFKSNQDSATKLKSLTSKLTSLQEADERAILNKCYKDSISYFKNLDFQIDDNLFPVLSSFTAKYAETIFEIKLSDAETHYMGHWSYFEITAKNIANRPITFFVSLRPIYEKKFTITYTGSIEDQIKNREDIISSYVPVSSVKFSLHVFANEIVERPAIADVENISDLYENLFKYINTLK
jgi:hypothetical protein